MAIDNGICIVLCGSCAVNVVLALDVTATGDCSVASSFESGDAMAVVVTNNKLIDTSNPKIPFFDFMFFLS